MLGKKERRTKQKDVDMSIVKQLLRWQKDQNNILDGTGAHCDLHPKTSEPCVSCIYRKKCLHYEWERNYIQKHKEALKDAKKRKKIVGKNKQKSEAINSNFVNEPVYPCEPFEFACPNKNFCQEGRNCPWEE